MSASATHHVTKLLVGWTGGDDAALDRLTPLVHEELRRIARRHMGHERAGHTLQPPRSSTRRICGWSTSGGSAGNNRAHFFAMAARLMRRILVDDARARGYQKRGGGRHRSRWTTRLLGSRRSRRISWRSTMRSRRWRRIDSEKPGGRAAVLRRTERRGDRDGPEDLARDRHARLEARESVAAARAETGPVPMEPERWRQIPGSTTRRRTGLRPRGLRSFTRRAVAMPRSSGRSNRCWRTRVRQRNSSRPSGWSRRDSGRGPQGARRFPWAHASGTTK